MITERDLDEAIAECQGQRNPNTTTCIKLAAFLIIREHLFPEQEETMTKGHSYAPGPITYESGTEFADLVRGLPWDEVLPIIDELMDALRVLNPKLYESVLRKLER